VSIWRGKQPSVRIALVMSGKTPLEGEDPAIQSVCSKYIFDGATAILKLPNKETRRAALDMVPALLRPHLEREIMRLFRR